MLSKTPLALLITCAAASASFADAKFDTNEFTANCTSAVGGDAITISRSGGAQKGQIATGDIEGEAQILLGLGNVTFLLIQGKDVVTLVVDTDSMNYDLAIKGPHQKTDRGTCAAS